VKLMLLPAVDDLLSGRVRVSQLRDVELDDLLGRDPVDLDAGALGEMIRGKVVMVTGAGGSIGAELCRQIARFNPGLLVLYELNEFALYSIDEEFAREFPAVPIRCLIGDVKDAARLDHVLSRFRPSVLFHAAAYKHVPMMETDNAWCAVQNNVLGTLRVAEAVAKHPVERFVFVSSDKAVNPTSVMGATKRLGEVLLQLWAMRTDIPTVIVRFGNVLGSAGSVVPKFRAQIAAGGPLTVTHPEIERYFMSIPEASQLVLQSALMGRSGEIFVLDMGEPVRIVDLARDMISLSGFSDDEIRITFTGLRPGEKLYEELLADGESTLPTRHAKIRVAQPIRLPERAWEVELIRWLQQDGPVDDGAVRRGLARFLPEYRPYPGDASPPGDNVVEFPQPRLA
jgi:FlaA1/EpsC-like NDP-sugar epimerase